MVMCWAGVVCLTIIKIYVAIVLLSIVQVIFRGLVQVGVVRVSQQVGSFQSNFSAKRAVQVDGDNKLNHLERDRSLWMCRSLKHCRGRSCEHRHQSLLVPPGGCQAHYSPEYKSVGQNRKKSLTVTAVSFLSETLLLLPGLTWEWRPCRQWSECFPAANQWTAFCSPAANTHYPDKENLTYVTWKI